MNSAGRSGDFKLKKSIGEDRISDLPDELVSQILTLLPTKDAASLSVLSKKFRRLFRWMPSLDFDDSTNSHCSNSPDLTDRFKTFKLLVDAVLRVSQSPKLSRFRLHFGGDSSRRNLCDLDHEHLYSWIRFSVTRPLGITEIDLAIHVRNPPWLPASMLFTSNTLEVLTLDFNFKVDHGCYLSSVCLPNLKVLHLRSLILLDDNFLPKLVYTCPSLEVLEARVWISNYVSSMVIHSSSLKRLVLDILREDDDSSFHFMVINTPNLEYLKYDDTLAFEYFIYPLNALAKVYIRIGRRIASMSKEESFRSMLKLVRGVSHDPHLSLMGLSLEDLDLDELKDQLPVFPNLRYLELGCSRLSKWDIVLLPFLKCSPVLETLAFPEGLFYLRPRKSKSRDAKLEHQFCSTQTHKTLSSSNVKKVEISNYWVSERELVLVEFLLKTVTSLEELVVRLSGGSEENPELLESTLKRLPRASIACSIQVQ